MRDAGQKITLQSQTMESYVPVTDPSCLTALNEAYLPLFYQHRKTVRAHSEVRNVIQLKAIQLVGQKDSIEVIDNIQHKLEHVDMSNISSIMNKCNEKLIIKLRTFWYNLPHQSSHYK